jgi:hypothetical protein
MGQYFLTLHFSGQTRREIYLKLLLQLFHIRCQGCQIFKPKIPVWVNFWRPWNGKCWYCSCPFGIHYGHLVHIFYGHLEILMVMWYFLYWLYLFWYIVTRKNWQPWFVDFPFCSIAPTTTVSFVFSSLCWLLWGRRCLVY